MVQESSKLSSSKDDKGQKKEVKNIVSFLYILPTIFRYLLITFKKAIFIATHLIKTYFGF